MNESDRRHSVAWRNGFPSVRYAEVVPPLSSLTNWASFFAHFRQGGRNTETRIAMPVFEAPEAGAAESVDLHCQSVGRHSLAKDGSLQVDAAKAARISASRGTTTTTGTSKAKPP